uniref:Uncharacterized protein n=1 Tax=Ditylum brightwellii TaxID=49249 RepID=A0A7S4SFC4_9STRA|mmetsp:Transcript_54607/g.81327  ORF Transcript_54607/g.81327 Transcript_54607/m.81327 type:complete len:134 (+) Transcript_54607:116-517(+)
MSPTNVRVIIGSQLKRRIMKSNSRQHHHKRFESYAKWTSRCAKRKKDTSNQTLSTVFSSVETDHNYSYPDTNCRQESSRSRRRKNIVMEKLITKIIPSFTKLTWRLRRFLQGKRYDRYKGKPVLIRSRTGYLA